MSEYQKARSIIKKMRMSKAASKDVAAKAIELEHEEYLEIAHCGFAHMLEGTMALGKGVSQTICLGPETLWRFKQAGITSLDASEYHTED